MPKEIPEDFSRAPRGFEAHDLRAIQMPNHDAVGALEAMEKVRTSDAAPEVFDPLDHDHNGKKGGSLPKAQRVKK